jgi:hypothetical protein
LKAFDNILLPGFKTYFENNDTVQCLNETLKLLRLSWFAHTIQLVVEDGIKHASNAIAVLTKVAKFSHSCVLFGGKLQNLSQTIPRSTVLAVTAILNIPIKTLNDILTEVGNKELCITEKE